MNAKIVEKFEKVAPDIAVGSVGAGIGAYLGSSIGIAAFGTAVAGTLPVAIVLGGFAWCGYRLYIRNQDS